MNCKGYLSFLLIILLLLQLSPSYATADTASETGSRAEVEGLVVDDRSVISDKNWTVMHNIIVRSGGELIVNNTRVVMESEEKMIVIAVEPGGRLTLINSSFSVLDEGDIINEMPFFYGFKFDINGDLFMSNSTISYTGYNNSIAHSDQSVIGNTKKWRFRGFTVLGGSCEIRDSKFENNTGLYFTNSSLKIYDSKIVDGVSGFVLENTSLEVDNCTFLDDLFNVRIIDTVYYYISNSIFKSSNIFLSSEDGLTAINSNGHIENCTFEMIHVATASFGGVFVIRNSTFIDNEYAMIAGDSYIHWENNSADDSGRIGKYAYYGIGNQIIGIQADDCDVVMKNSSFSNTGLGAVFSNSDVYIENCLFNDSQASATFTDSDVYIENSLFEDSEGSLSFLSSEMTVRNITITNHTIGMEMLSSTCSVLNSTISENVIGIQTQDSILVLHENEIVNNTDWGIVSEISDVRFSGENFVPPPGWPVAKAVNGLGNLVEIAGFKVDVYDSFDLPLVYMDVKIESECFNEYHMKSEFLSFYYYNATTTDTFGQAEFYWLIEYVMVNGYEKIYCTDYTVTAWYQFSGGNLIENSTMVNLETYSGESVMLTLDLPNISMNESELQLSKSKVKKGETLTLKTKAHYTGPSNVNIPAFDAILYIDGVELQIIKITDLSPNNPEVELEFSWVAESEVPYPEQIESRLIKVVMDIPDDFEYNVGTTRFTSDNDVTARVDIDIERRDEGRFRSGSMLTWYLFLFGIFILIMIPIIIAFAVIKRREKKKIADLRGSREEEEMDRGIEE
jgi:hypothetical protein